jgi:hypothetical protein
MYSQLITGRLQDILPGASKFFARNFDHVVPLFSLQSVDKLDIALVISAMFFQARRSVTITIDEIPDDYNEDLRKRGDTHMVQTNHIATMSRFEPAFGWRLVQKRRTLAWTFPHIGVGVYATILRWEACDETSDSAAAKEPANSRWQKGTHLVLLEFSRCSCPCQKFLAAKARSQIFIHDPWIASPTLLCNRRQRQRLSIFRCSWASYCTW